MPNAKNLCLLVFCVLVVALLVGLISVRSGLAVIYAAIVCIGGNLLHGYRVFASYRAQHPDVLLRRMKRAGVLKIGLCALLLALAGYFLQPKEMIVLLGTYILVQINLGLITPRSGSGILKEKV